MRTTVNLDPEAYRLARAIALQKHETVGKVLGDALLDKFRSFGARAPSLEIDSDGFPVIYIGHSITPQDVAEAIEE